MKKIISIILVISLFTTNFQGIGNANSREKSINPIISSKYGKVVDEFHSDASNTIYLIEDLHCNKEVQVNIKSIIESISKYENGKIIIGQEGSSKKIDTSLISTIKNKKRKTRIINHFLGQGYITGAELFDIKYPNKAHIYGIEDEKLYKRNFELLCKNIENQEKLVVLTQKLEKIVERGKKLFYTKDLKKLEQIESDYKNGYITFKNYTNSILEFNKGINLEGYTNLSNYLVSDEIFENISLPKVHTQALFVIKKLESLITDKDYNKIKNLENKEYYTHLSEIIKKYNIKLEKKFYSDLIKYLKYIDIRETTDLAIVLNEIEDLKQSLKFSKNIKILNQLIYCDRILQILEKIAQNKANSLEVETWKYENKKFKKEMSQICKKISYKDHLEGYEDVFKNILRFYDLAEIRNEVLVKNILRYLTSLSHSRAGGNPVPASIMIVGGFHTKGITDILRTKGISYKVIRPRITKESNHKEKYLKRIKEQAHILNIPLNTLNNLNMQVHPNLTFVNLISAFESGSLTESRIRQVLPLDSNLREKVFKSLIKIFKESNRTLALILYGNRKRLLSLTPKDVKNNYKLFKYLKYKGLDRDAASKCVKDLGEIFRVIQEIKDLHQIMPKRIEKCLRMLGIDSINHLNNIGYSIFHSVSNGEADEIIDYVERISNMAVFKRNVVIDMCYDVGEAPSNGSCGYISLCDALVDHYYNEEHEKDLEIFRHLFGEDFIYAYDLFDSKTKDEKIREILVEALKEPENRDSMINIFRVFFKRYQVARQDLPEFFRKSDFPEIYQALERHETIDDFMDWVENVGYNYLLQRLGQPATVDENGTWINGVFAGVLARTLNIEIRIITPTYTHAFNRRSENGFVYMYHDTVRNHYRPVTRMQSLEVKQNTFSIDPEICFDFKRTGGYIPIQSVDEENDIYDFTFDQIKEQVVLEDQEECEELYGETKAVELLKNLALNSGRKLVFINQTITSFIDKKNFYVSIKMIWIFNKLIKQTSLDDVRPIIEDFYFYHLNLLVMTENQALERSNYMRDFFFVLFVQPVELDPDEQLPLYDIRRFGLGYESFGAFFTLDVGIIVNRLIDHFDLNEPGCNTTDDKNENEDKPGFVKVIFLGYLLYKIFITFSGAVVESLSAGTDRKYHGFHPPFSRRARYNKPIIEYFKDEETGVEVFNTGSIYDPEFYISPNQFEVDDDDAEDVRDEFAVDFYDDDDDDELSLEGVIDYKNGGIIDPYLGFNVDAYLEDEYEEEQKTEEPDDGEDDDGYDDSEWIFTPGKGWHWHGEGYDGDDIEDDTVDYGDYPDEDLDDEAMSIDGFEYDRGQHDTVKSVVVDEDLDGDDDLSIYDPIEYEEFEEQTKSSGWFGSLFSGVRNYVGEKVSQARSFFGSFFSSTKAGNTTKTKTQTYERFSGGIVGAAASSYSEERMDEIRQQAAREAEIKPTDESGRAELDVEEEIEIIEVIEKNGRPYKRIFYGNAGLRQEDGRYVKGIEWTIGDDTYYIDYTQNEGWIRGAKIYSVYNGAGEDRGKIGDLVKPIWATDDLAHEVIIDHDGVKETIHLITIERDGHLVTDVSMRETKTSELEIEENYDEFGNLLRKEEVDELTGESIVTNYNSDGSVKEDQEEEIVEESETTDESGIEELEEEADDVDQEPDQEREANIPGRIKRYEEIRDEFGNLIEYRQYGVTRRRFEYDENSSLVRVLVYGESLVTNLNPDGSVAEKQDVELKEVIDYNSDRRVVSDDSMENENIEVIEKDGRPYKRIFYGDRGLLQADGMHIQGIEWTIEEDLFFKKFYIDYTMEKQEPNGAKSYYVFHKSRGIRMVIGSCIVTNTGRDGSFRGELTLGAGYNDGIIISFVTKNEGGRLVTYISNRKKRNGVWEKSYDEFENLIEYKEHGMTRERFVYDEFGNLYRKEVRNTIIGETTVTHYNPDGSVKEDQEEDKSRSTITSIPSSVIGRLAKRQIDDESVVAEDVKQEEIETRKQNWYVTQKVYYGDEGQGKQQADGRFLKGEEWTIGEDTYYIDYTIEQVPGREIYSVFNGREKKQKMGFVRKPYWATDDLSRKIWFYKKIKIYDIIHLITREREGQLVTDVSMRRIKNGDIETEENYDESGQLYRKEKKNLLREKTKATNYNPDGSVVSEEIYVYGVLSEVIDYTPDGAVVYEPDSYPVCLESEKLSEELGLINENTEIITKNGRPYKRIFYGNAGLRQEDGRYVEGIEWTIGEDRYYIDYTLEYGETNGAKTYYVFDRARGRRKKIGYVRKPKWATDDLAKEVITDHDGVKETIQLITRERDGELVTDVSARIVVAEDFKIVESYDEFGNLYRKEVRNTIIGETTVTHYNPDGSVKEDQEEEIVEESETTDESPRDEVDVEEDIEVIEKNEEPYKRIFYGNAGLLQEDGRYVKGIEWIIEEYVFYIDYTELRDDGVYYVLNEARERVGECRLEEEDEEGSFQAEVTIRIGDRGFTYKDIRLNFNIQNDKGNLLMSLSRVKTLTWDNDPREDIYNEDENIIEVRVFGAIRGKYFYDENENLLREIVYKFNGGSIIVEEVIDYNPDGSIADEETDLVREEDTEVLNENQYMRQRVFYGDIGLERPGGKFIEGEEITIGDKVYYIDYTIERWEVNGAKTYYVLDRARGRRQVIGFVSKTSWATDDLAREVITDHDGVKEIIHLITRERDGHLVTDVSSRFIKTEDFKILESYDEFGNLIDIRVNGVFNKRFEYDGNGVLTMQLMVNSNLFTIECYDEFGNSKDLDPNPDTHCYEIQNINGEVIGHEVTDTRFGARSRITVMIDDENGSKKVVHIWYDENYNEVHRQEVGGIVDAFWELVSVARDGVVNLYRYLFGTEEQGSSGIPGVSAGKYTEEQLEEMRQQAARDRELADAREAEERKSERQEEETEPQCEAPETAAEEDVPELPVHVKRGDEIDQSQYQIDDGQFVSSVFNPEARRIVYVKIGEEEENRRDRKLRREIKSIKEQIRSTRKFSEKVELGRQLDEKMKILGGRKARRLLDKMDERRRQREGRLILSLEEARILERSEDLFVERNMQIVFVREQGENFISNEGKQILEASKDLLKKRDRNPENIDKAIRNTKIALRSNPNSLESRLFLVVAYLVKGEESRANKFLRKTLAKFPYSENVYLYDEMIEEALSYEIDLKVNLLAIDSAITFESYEAALQIPEIVPESSEGMSLYTSRIKPHINEILSVIRECEQIAIRERNGVLRRFRRQQQSLSQDFSGIVKELIEEGYNVDVLRASNDDRKIVFIITDEHAYDHQPNTFGWSIRDELYDMFERIYLFSKEANGDLMMFGEGRDSVEWDNRKVSQYLRRPSNMGFQKRLSQYPSFRLIYSHPNANLKARFTTGSQAIYEEEGRIIENMEQMQMRIGNELFYVTNLRRLSSLFREHDITKFLAVSKKKTVGMFEFVLKNRRNSAIKIFHTGFKHVFDIEGFFADDTEELGSIEEDLEGTTVVSVKFKDIRKRFGLEFDIFDFMYFNKFISLGNKNDRIEAVRRLLTKYKLSLNNLIVNLEYRYEKEQQRVDLGQQDSLVLEELKMSLTILKEIHSEMIRRINRETDDSMSSFSAHCGECIQTLFNRTNPVENLETLARVVHNKQRGTAWKQGLPVKTKRFVKKVKRVLYQKFEELGFDSDNIKTVTHDTAIMFTNREGNIFVTTEWFKVMAFLYDLMGEEYVSELIEAKLEHESRDLLFGHVEAALGDAQILVDFNQISDSLSRLVNRKYVLESERGLLQFRADLEEVSEVLGTSIPSIVERLPLQRDPIDQSESVISMDGEMYFESRSSDGLRVIVKRNRDGEISSEPIILPPSIDIEIVEKVMPNNPIIRFIKDSVLKNLFNYLKQLAIDPLENLVLIYAGTRLEIKGFEAKKFCSIYKAV